MAEIRIDWVSKLVHIVDEESGEITKSYGLTQAEARKPNPVTRIEIGRWVPSPEEPSPEGTNQTHP